MLLKLFEFIIIVTCVCQQCSHCRNSDVDASDAMDLLEPYEDYHSPRVKRSNRHIRECQEVKYGNVTHSKIKANPDTNISYPFVEVKHMVKQIGQYYFKHPVTVRYQRVDYPLNTLSVLEPLEAETCQPGYSNLTTVSETSTRANCVVAVNGGFFNTTTGACLGNIVSDSMLVQDAGGIQNAHFGITEDGYIYTGYLSELDLVAQQFKQLIGGVIWLIRDGEVYIDQSKNYECPEIQETGTLDRFITVQSARSAVGHDKDGRVILVQIDGETNVRGVTLYEFADILLDLGVVNAINLDGGGSTTTVINNTLVNYPSDKCLNSTFNCEREITTILCVHEPHCQVKDCNNHGVCVLGTCNCSKYWTGTDCNTLSCPDNCNQHGHCSPDGCVCSDGWYGYNCSTPCTLGYYGYNCSKQCYCLHDGYCDSISGRCNCSPGYTGKFCETECAFGYYGDNCKEVCTCDNGCFCHPVTGSCNLSTLSSDLQQASSCFVEAEIKSHHLIYSQSDQYGICVSSVISMSVVAAMSIILNISLICLHFISKKRHKAETKQAVKKTIKKIINAKSTDNETDTELEEEADEETKL
ncbi:N-acetylglucosamine-1-phosphodiester alpha-N-acetylglucosaminidase isoform X1 [Patella vulgata]|uniref:N-acetylglucosamine-1-phosphodiester alpha-N-acetylglucosaminidase isoform X1 n=1 Tax=Patella vulgata TaxID=6465 RepID=UPI0021805D9C|nr:N-acetylglucosamine-1-phosphodiester alpha-N-acetylglucosaminidase isoform X1 [Patella vulgata]